MASSDGSPPGRTKKIVITLVLILFAATAGLICCQNNIQYASADGYGEKPANNVPDQSIAVETHDHVNSKLPAARKKTENHKATIEKPKPRPARQKHIVRRTPGELRQPEENKAASEAQRVPTAVSDNQPDGEAGERNPIQGEDRPVEVEIISKPSRLAIVEGRPFIIVISGDSQKITIKEGDGVKGNSMTLSSNHCARTVTVPSNRPVHFHLVGSFNTIYVQQNRIFHRMTTSYFGKSNIFKGTPRPDSPSTIVAGA